jgi:N,N'-diacetyllegionaminate synthase
MSTFSNPYIIAEIGQAHEGSLGLAHSYIDALAKTGVSAIKFQMHIARAESSAFEPFRVAFSYEDKTRFDYWKRMEFSPEQWVELKKHCEEAGLDFLCSPFSNEAVDCLESMGVKAYKIGSGEVSNLLLLERIASTRKPVIISSGMSSYEELDIAVALFRSKDIEVAVLQCTTAYPTTPEQYGLNVIPELKARYRLQIGYSDHSAKVETCIAAAALGAEIFEFHVVFDRQMFGPDASSSLIIDEVHALTSSIKNIRCAMQHPVQKEKVSGYEEVRRIFGKSLSVNKSLAAGHILTLDDLEGKKPAGKGIPAAEFAQIIGRALSNPKRQWDFINEEDLI